MAVIFSEDDLFTLTEDVIEKLVSMAQKAELKRSRICLHHANDHLLHQMIIVFVKGTEVPIHRHHNKAESFHMIKGKLKLIFYDDNGNETESIVLEEPGGCSGAPYIFRLSSDRWHKVVPLTDITIVHEITTGPFIKDDMEILDLH